MSLSNSLHAKAASHHLERIGKSLLVKRNARDFSTCDIKVLMQTDYDMVHSSVVCAHSAQLAHDFENQRGPYPPVDLTAFHPASVKRVMDWMYSGEISIPESAIAQDLAVAAHLRVTMLQRQLEQTILRFTGSPIIALNVASERAFSVKPQRTFRPNVTLLHVTDETMLRLVRDLHACIDKLTEEDVAKLTLNSVVAAMAVVLPMAEKVPLINMAVHWIMTKKPEKEIIHSILKSIVISDVSFNTLYTLRYSLNQYLTDPIICGNSQLSICPSGSIGLRIATKNDIPLQKKAPPPPSPVERKPFRTRSELSEIAKLPDYFEKKDAITPPYQDLATLRRDTTDGFPKYFTRSEVEHLQTMTDPFGSESTREIIDKPVNKKMGFAGASFAKYPEWDPTTSHQKAAAEKAKQAEFRAKYSESHIAQVRSMPDPFASKRTRSPVVMRPVNGSSASNTNVRSQPREVALPECYGSYGISRADKALFGNDTSVKTAKSATPHNNNGKQSWSRAEAERMARNRQPNGSDFVVTPSTKSPRSARSVTSNPPVINPRRTDSEILEINAYPSLRSNISTSNSSGINGKKEQPKNNFQKSDYLYPK
ncbi:unnamed protein product [Caenorhabditis sp. 36 PRJEB53466]|nr:unnamed protein product [Caenorhabditis sp. 36 PRJEB53466]